VRSDQFEYRQVEVVRSVEEQEVDSGVEIGEGAQRVADTNLDEGSQTSAGEVLRGTICLGRQ
jgi:hypothetical protein